MSRQLLGDWGILPQPFLVHVDVESALASALLKGDESMSISDAQPTQVSLEQYAALPNAPVDISSIPARIASAALQQTGAAATSISDAGMALPEQDVNAWTPTQKVMVAVAVVSVAGGAYWYQTHRRRR
jgi:hypothetical protein